MQPFKGNFWGEHYEKDMFRQFQMIQWSEMLKVMAPYHGTMGPRQCVSLPQVPNDSVLRNIIS